LHKVNLTFLASTLPVGGAENVLLELVKNMDMQKFNVNIICLREGGRMSEELSRLGVKVTDNFITGRFDIRTVWKLPSLLRSTNTHVLCMLNHDDAMFWGKMCSRFARVPVSLLWVHSNLIPGTKLWVRLVNRLTMNLVSNIITISGIHRKRILSTYPSLREDKLTIIYNGVDTARYDSTAQEDNITDLPDLSGFSTIIGTVARLSPEKDLDVLMKAAKLVLEKKENALFVIVGDGPERGRYEQTARTLGVEDNVRFLGMRRDIPRILKMFDIAVLSSKDEVFPMFLLEAMASALPVVSTRVGSMEEVIEDGTTGFLVESGDYKGLADHILALSADGELAARMGRNGRERVEKFFSTRKMVDDIQTLIVDLLEKAP